MDHPRFAPADYPTDSPTVNAAVVGLESDGEAEFVTALMTLSRAGYHDAIELAVAARADWCRACLPALRQQYGSHWFCEWLARALASRPPADDAIAALVLACSSGDYRTALRLASSADVIRGALDVMTTRADLEGALDPQAWLRVLLRGAG